MAKLFDSANSNYTDYDLVDVWENSIRIDAMEIKYAPVTDKNPEEGLIIHITGKCLKDGPEGSGVIKGQYVEDNLFSRNKLNPDWQEVFGALKDGFTKDGRATKALVPKFKPTNVKYRISKANVRNVETGEVKTVYSSPKVLGVYRGQDYFPIGSMDNPREYSGESQWELVTE